VHNRNSQSYHAPAVERRLDFIDVHRKRDAKEGVLTQLCKKLMNVAPMTALYREAP